MKFSQVAHLYIGCKVVHTGLADIVTLDGTHLPYVTALATKCKPILFPLSAMTEEHIKEHRKLCRTVIGNGYTETPESFKYLFDNHFDLFNLIEQGEAIDATTITPNPYDK